jgi:hypothetical protein
MLERLQYPVTQEAVTYALMEKLLEADGKMLAMKGNSSSATSEEIAVAYNKAYKLVLGGKPEGLSK